jgi:general secretion pathway protein E
MSCMSVDSPRTPQLAGGISRAYLHHHRVCPKSFDSAGILLVAVAPNALLTHALDDLSIAYDCVTAMECVTQGELDLLIERLAASTDGDLAVDPSGQGDESLISDARELATQPPVVRYVNLLIREAFDAGASDIHLEATRDGLSTRFRIDGVLIPAPLIASDLQHAVVSRIKLLAELDIAERRRPQDGRIRARLEARELDLRVSTVPTLFGESVVLRLLERGGRPVTLEDLGMPPGIFDAVQRLSSKPHGMFVVTGPTGSGKTTTLYAALGCRNPGSEKIITVEDPVEYQLSGITQVPVNRQAGVTFASALRSLLRQDPDVLMIGEMRDAETAEIAVQAAMTGHLVFTTLHTNDAVAAVPRMLDLSVADYLIGGTLDGVLAQRLVRRICAACRMEYEPSREHVALVSGAPARRFQAFRGAGCGECRGTGYRGRTGIFQLLLINEDIRDAIAARASRLELKRLAELAGLLPMRVDGWTKVQEGVTTVEEVLRVMQG